MLKTNETNIQLGINFGANEDTVSAILKHVINILFELSSRWLWWFSREELDLTMFQTFKASFPKNRVIIDGTEIKTQMPKLQNSFTFCSQAHICRKHALQGKCTWKIEEWMQMTSD